MDFFDVLTSFSKVETVIGLLSFIIAGFLGYMAYQSHTKLHQLGSILEKADTQTKADLAVALSGVMPGYRIPDLNQKQGFEIVKLQLSQREKEFKTRFNLLRLGMLLFFLAVLALIVKNYREQAKVAAVQPHTSGPNSPVVVGDSTTINYHQTMEHSDTTP